MRIMFVALLMADAERTVNTGFTLASRAGPAPIFLAALLTKDDLMLWPRFIGPVNSENVAV